jgi:hypothetical protein
MVSFRTAGLFALATLAGGLLAGVNVDRELVATPAWRRLGVQQWARFSRHADLRAGLALYPAEAIAGLALSLGAALSLRRDTASSRGMIPIIGATALSALGLALTVKAAPKILSVRSETEVEALSAAFDGFSAWGGPRAGCQILAFLAQLWALTAIATEGRAGGEREAIWSAT